jgi:GntR family transcriptional repressor for pyruvate dehydrogenase complex
MNNIIKPIKKTRVVEQTIESIYDMVKSQGLKAGDKFPTERDLSEALNISRSSLREAIRVLDMMGIIKVEHGHGITLSGFNLAQSIATPLSFLMATDKKMLLELYEFRKMIEVESAKSAALKARENDLCHLNAVYAELKEHKQDRYKAIALEIQLHEGIAKIGNPIVGEIVIAIHDVMEASREKTVDPQGVSEETIVLMGKIVEAIANHDPELAGNYMLEHVNAVYKKV